MAVNCPDTIFWTIVNVLPVGIYQKQKVSLKELRQCSHHAIKVDGKVLHSQFHSVLLMATAPARQLNNKVCISFKLCTFNLQFCLQCTFSLQYGYLTKEASAEN